MPAYSKWNRFVFKKLYYIFFLVTFLIRQNPANIDALAMEYFNYSFLTTHLFNH